MEYVPNKLNFETILLYETPSNALDMSRASTCGLDQIPTWTACLHEARFAGIDFGV